MNIEIDFRDHIPIYIQLMDQIKQLIAADELKPGEQLPTVRQLAADLRVNFNTIARTYRLLDEEGIISTQHGRGTFILTPLPEEDAKALRRKGLRRLTHEYLTSAKRLGYTPEEVQDAFEKKLDEWKNTGTLSSPEESQES